MKRQYLKGTSGANVSDKQNENRNNRKRCDKEYDMKVNYDQLQVSENICIVFEFYKKVVNEEKTKEELQEVKNILSSMLKKYINTVS